MIIMKIYQTRGSSNLSVVKTYSKIALRMSENLYQIMCSLVTKFVIKKSSLILIICNEFNARCLGVYIFHHLIYYCGGGFEILTAIANWIYTVSKIVLEFVLTQMTQTCAQSCDKSYTFVIITVKNITWRESIKVPFFLIFSQATMAFHELYF